MWPVLVYNLVVKSPYLYVLTSDSLGYVLENAHVHGQIQGIIHLDA